MPWYCIMDERAHVEPDDALVLQVCEEGASLQRACEERDLDWPGMPVVDMHSWEVVDGGDTHY